MAGDRVSVPVDADTRLGLRKIHDMEDTLELLTKRAYAARILAEDAGMHRQLMGITKQLQVIDAIRATPFVDAENADEMMTELLGIAAQLDKIDAKVAKAHVGIDDSDAERRLALLMVQLTALGQQLTTIRMKTDDAGILAHVAAVKAALASLHDQVFKLTGVSMVATPDPAATGHALAVIRQQMKALGLADIADVNVDPARMAAVLQRLKMLVQRVPGGGLPGLADLMDLNVPPAVVMAQLARLKAALTRSGVKIADILDVNVPASEVAVQVAKVNAALASIPQEENVRLGIPVLPAIADIMKLRTALGTLQSEQLKMEFGIGNVGALAAAEAAMAGLQAEAGKLVPAVSRLHPALDGLIGSELALAATSRGLAKSWAMAGVETKAWYGGLGLLNWRISAAGGLLGSIALWHVAMDIIIETLAMLVPALGTMVAGLGMWGAAAYETGREVVQQFRDIITVSQALDQVVPPLTDRFEELQDAVRPQVFELAGLALIGMQKNTGILQKLALETGSTLDRLGAHLLYTFQQGGEGLQHFFEVGKFMLTGFGAGLHNIGTFITALIGVTERTHIAQYLMDIGVGLTRILGVAADLMRTPVGTWFTAAVLGLHGLWVWGGLASTMLMELTERFAALIGHIPGMARPMGALAVAAGATNNELAKMGARTPAMRSLAEGIIAGDSGMIAFASGAGIAEKNLVRLVARQPEIRGIAAAMGATSVNVARVASGLAKSGETAEQVAVKMAGSAGRYTELRAAAAGVSAEVANIAIAAGATVPQMEKLAARLGTAAQNAGTGGRLMNAFTGAVQLGTKYWPLLAIAAGIGLGIVIDKLVTARTETQRWLDDMQKALREAETPLKGYNLLISDIVATHTRIANTQRDLRVQQDLANNSLDVYRKVAGEAAAASVQASQKAGDYGTVQRTLATRQQQLNFAVYEGAAVTPQYARALQTAGKGVQDYARAEADAADKLKQLQAGQQQHFGQLNNLTVFLGKVSAAYGTDLTQSLNLATIAGVKFDDMLKGPTDEAFQRALLQVAGLVEGYKAMGQQTGVIGHDMNALAVAASTQAKSMDQLNSAWDSFIKIVAGPVSTFLTFSQGLTTYATDAKEAGGSVLRLSAAQDTLAGAQDRLTAAQDRLASLQKSGKATAAQLATAHGSVATAAGQVAAAQDNLNKVTAQGTGSMLGLSGAVVSSTRKYRTASVQLQQDFQAIINDVEGMFDAMRMAQAVSGGGGDFIAFVKLATQVLIPLAGGNKAAAAEIYALAQEADYAGPNSLAGLAKWAGHTKDPLDAMYKAMQNASIGASNLSLDAQRLGHSLQEDLNSLIKTAVETQVLTPAMNKATQAIVAHGAGSFEAAQAQSDLYDKVLKLTGSASEAKQVVNLLTGAVTGNMYATYKSGDAQKQLMDIFTKAHAPASTLHSDLLAITEAALIYGTNSKQYADAVKQATADTVALGVGTDGASKLVNAMGQQVLPKGTSALIDFANKGLKLGVKGAQDLTDAVVGKLGPGLSNMGDLTLPQNARAFLNWAGKSKGQGGLGLSWQQAEDLYNELVTLQGQIDTMTAKSLPGSEGAFETWAKTGLKGLAQPAVSGLWKEISTKLGPALNLMGDLTLPENKDAFIKWAESLGLGEDQAKALWDYLANTVQPGMGLFSHEWLPDIEKAFSDWATGGLNLTDDAARNLWQTLATKLGPDLSNDLARSVLSSQQKFEQWAGPGGGSGLGLTKAQADKLYQFLKNTLQPQIDRMHGKNIYMYIPPETPLAQAKKIQQAVNNLRGSTLYVAVVASGRGAIGYQVTQQSSFGFEIVKPNTGSMRFFGGGGRIGGGGAPTADDQVIRASTDEYVIRAASAKKLGYGFLDRLNRYATGGRIGVPLQATSDWERDKARWFSVTTETSYARMIVRAFQAFIKKLQPPAGAMPSAGLSTTASVRAEQLYALSLFSHFGWGPNQLPALIALWNGESGWNPNARNPSSGAYGIPQALPASKMGFLGNTWAGQILWGLNYIHDRYGSPSAAYSFWLRQSPHWYAKGGKVMDTGGTIPPGASMVYNGTGRNEHLSPDRTTVIQLEVVSGGGDFDEFLVKWLREKVRVRGGGNVQMAFGRR